MHSPLRYVRSCGLLLLPGIAWNIALFEQLPPAFAANTFWRDIPATLAALENLSRALVFTLPFAMPLELSSPTQRYGLTIFAIGTLVYFSSWLPLIYWPTSAWSSSAVGFIAPAYTPALWLLGLSLVGQRLFWGSNYRWWFFLILSAGFISAHVYHTAVVYARVH